MSRSAKPALNTGASAPAAFAHSNAAAMTVRNRERNIVPTSLAGKCLRVTGGGASGFPRPGPWETTRQYTPRGLRRVPCQRGRLAICAGRESFLQRRRERGRRAATAARAIRRRGRRLVPVAGHVRAGPLQVFADVRPRLGAVG